MQKKMLFAASAAVLIVAPFFAQAEQKPRDLAMESYRFIESRQNKLGGLIKDANKVEYFAQFSSPAKAITAKWPQPLKEDYYDYADCYFALDLLIKYSDQAISGMSPKNPVLLLRKTRFNNAYRECQRDLRKSL